MSCKKSINESWIDDRLTRLPLPTLSEHITGLEDAQQINLVPELPPSGGYQNITTVMDVFSRNLFACPTTSQDAKNSC